MTPKLQKIIGERFEILPEVLREKLLDSARLREQLISLGKNHNLTAEQMAVIEDEVVLTLLAFTPYPDLPVHIARELGIEENAVLPVVGSMLSEVFTPEILKELDALPTSETSEQIPTSPAAPIPMPTPISPSAHFQQPTQTAAPAVPHATPPPASVPLAPMPPPTIPQYQKPLANVPPYRNANLYQKPPQ